MSAFPNRRHGELGGTRRPRPDEPRWRWWLWRLDWVWRRVVPLVGMGLAVYAIAGLQTKVDKTTDALQRQADGRRIAIEVLCGGISGVEDAGRRVLTGTLPPPAPHRPLPSGRRRLASAYANSYALVISRRVVEQAGANARDVLRRDGSINCGALKQKSRANVGATATP